MLSRIPFVAKIGLLSGVGTAVAYQTGFFDSPLWSSLRVVRFGRAALAAFLVSVDYKWSLSCVDEHDAEGYARVRSQVHQRSADRLLRMCSKNGGLFIKLGQHVGSMDYLLPREYVQTFKVFHSDAPKTPLDRLMAVVEEELGQPVNDIFKELDDDPLGAASLAQCHRGILRDGREVAVKIQHPDVRNNAYTDMDTVDFLVSCVKWAFPTFQFRWLAEEVRRNLPSELDFHNEAGHMEKVQKIFGHFKFLKVPDVYWEYTTTRVLTMEYCNGGKIDNLNYIRQHRLSVNEIIYKLGKLYSEMIFQRGYVHCDPHPGNVLVRNNPDTPSKRQLQIVLLDHGLYQTLTDNFRLTYCQLWEGLIERDREAIKRCCLTLNAGQLYPLLACIVTARSWDSIQAGISQVERSEAEHHEIRMEVMNYFSDISQLLNTVPREMLLILKTNDLLRSLEHKLSSNVHVQSHLTMSRSCLRALEENDITTASSWYQCVIVWCRSRIKLAMISILYEIWLWVQYITSLYS